MTMRNSNTEMELLQRWKSSCSLPASFKASPRFDFIIQLLFVVKLWITRRWFCSYSVRAEIPLFTASILVHSGTLLPA